METPVPNGVGRARYTYRLRVSAAAQRTLMAEWDRCRWVWNQCVEQSKAQRVDTARKWAKRVASDHDAVAVEDFRPKFLSKTTMARKAADGAISATKMALVEMCRKHGRDIHLVNPANTTTDCGQCGARTKHRLPLSQRTYTCTECGNSRPRDTNSAIVMLVRAGLTPAGGEGVSLDVAPRRSAA